MKTKRDLQIIQSGIVREFLNKFGYQIFNDSYIDSKTRLNLIDQYGYKYYITYSVIYVTLVGDQRPSIFSISNPYTMDNIKIWIKLNNKPFQLVGGKYLGAKTKGLIFECDNCNNNWESSWTNIEFNKGCPKCRKSKGECYVENFLKLYNIEYDQQHIFYDCRNKNPLPFDFYIPRYNTCIEFNGRQHYEPVDVFGGLVGYELTQINDQIKTNYCKIKNINLLVIPFWNMSNIKKIIEDNFIS